MMLTSEQLELCREWATAPNRKWQTLNRSQWKYQFHEKTLVRYVEESTMDENIAPLILEYLASDSCKGDLQLYGQPVGAEWTPIRAWYELSNRAVGNVRSVRLYHALTTEPDMAGDGPYVVHDGCAYKVSWKYYWRQSEVMECPPSESGISYSISGLQRDPETGLFSYALEKRERVQQDIPEYVTGVTVFEERKEEAHFGVRGNLSEGGREASVGNGVVVTRKVSKNEDCTHDVHNTTTKDKPVSEAVVETHKTLRGTRRSVTSRNQSAPLPEASEVGESVANRKTESGLYDTTRTTMTVDIPGVIASSCEKSAAQHIDVETRVVDAGSEEAMLGDHVANPEQNTVVEKSVRLNEDGRTADVAERTRKVFPQEGGGTSASGLADEGTVQTSERTDNATERAVLPDRAVNKEVSVSNTPNGMGGFTSVTTTTEHFPFDSGEVSWEDDENVHIVRHYRNQSDIIMPAKGTSGSRSVNFQRNGHSSWDGGYGITRPRLESELGNSGGASLYGIRIIDKGRDVTYAKTHRRERYSWSWSNSLNETAWGTFYWVWEMRRVCTMQVRYIGLTSQRADALKAVLDELFTRNVKESTFDPSGNPGFFVDEYGASMRMADVVKYHITGSAWGVMLKVNETTMRLRTPNQFTGVPVFTGQYEYRFDYKYLFDDEERWSYDIPDGKENIE